MIVNLLYCSGILLGLFLNGCGAATKSSGYTGVRLPADYAQTKSAEFNRGYMHGCASGLSELGNQKYDVVKDRVKFLVNREYKSGWREGHAICQEDFLAAIQGEKKFDHTKVVKGRDRQEYDKIWNDLKK